MSYSGKGLVLDFMYARIIQRHTCKRSILNREWVKLKFPYLNNGLLWVDGLSVSPEINW